MNKKYILSLGVIGLALVVISLAVLFGVLPDVVRKKVNEEMVLKMNDTSDIYKNFINLSVPLQYKIWAFEANIKNFDYKHINTIDFKLRGPYVYDEFREKDIIDFNENNVTYKQLKNYQFNKNDSCHGCNENDMISLFNPILALDQHTLDIMRTISKGKKEFKYYDSILYEWDSINSLLMTTENRIARAILNTTDPNEFCVGTGKDDKNQFEQILSYDGKNYLEVWLNNNNGAISRCNKLIGSDATQFPPGLKGDEYLWAFEPMLCYSLRAKHGILPDHEIKDMPTYRYTIERYNFEESLTNKCFCLESNSTACPSGLLNLKKCGGSEGIELIASPAFFYESPEHLEWTGLDRIIKLDEVTEEKQGTYFDVEPMTGIVLNARKRLMLSVKVRKNAIPQLANLATTEYYDYQIAPLLLIEESGTIDDENMKILKDKFFLKTLATWALVVLTITGIILISVSIFFYFIN